MKFSLKWLLVVVTYLAIATAACVQQGPGWRVALWVGNLVLVLYAVLVVVYFRGRKQAMALGFVLFSVAAAVGFATLSPIEDAIHPFVPGSVATASEMEEATRQVERLHWELMMSANAASSEYRDRTQQQYNAAAARLRGLVSLESLAGAIESLCVMAAGLVGCVVGWQVWMAAQQEKETTAG